MFTQTQTKNDFENDRKFFGEIDSFNDQLEFHLKSDNCIVAIARVLD